MSTPRLPHFHLTFSEPTDPWPNGSWALYQITGHEIARRYSLNASGEIVSASGWPGYVGLFATLAGATAEIERRTALYRDTIAVAAATGPLVYASRDGNGYDVYIGTHHLGHVYKTRAEDWRALRLDGTTAGYHRTRKAAGESLKPPTP